MEDIGSRLISELTDSDGALEVVRKHFGKPDYSHDSLRGLVKAGKVRCFVWLNGKLTIRQPDANTRGKDLFFLVEDLEALSTPNKPGPRPKAEK